jgi:hypothetical protein
MPLEMYPQTFQPSLPHLNQCLHIADSPKSGKHGEEMAHFGKHGERKLDGNLDPLQSFPPRGMVYDGNIIFTNVHEELNE